MAKYTGPDCRLCRREGCKLFLKGERCLSAKCAMEKRPVVPGQHGLARKKEKEYGTQLREKQKVKRAYGLQEKQFHALYEKAANTKGRTGDNLLSYFYIYDILFIIYLSMELFSSLQRRIYSAIRAFRCSESQILCMGRYSGGPPP